ncbi:MAG: phospholipase D-like domain-containing protein [Gammaproteobacteria bacterium]
MTDNTSLPPSRWRHGNRFRLLVDGDAFFPAMLDAIAAARRQVLLEMYLVESGQVADRFIDALEQAVLRGARVCLLLDDFGCRGLTAADRARLQQAGIELALYNPLRFGGLRRNLFRDHRKLLIVDNACAFVGGAGLTDDFDPGARPERHWHDVMVEIRGPVVADWQAVFAHTWAHWHSGAGITPEPNGPKLGHQAGRISLSGSDTRAPIKRSLLTRISRARERIWLATAYFVPSWKQRRRLARAARRGVDVRLLLPGPHTDHPAVRHAGRRFYASLLRAGVRIYEYQPRFLHAKVALIDDWVSIGSSNMDRWNLRWNLEANQEIDAPDFATEAAAQFVADFAASEEVRYATWRQRPWYERLAEWFWGRIDRWVDRHARR